MQIHLRSSAQESTAQLLCLGAYNSSTAQPLDNSSTAQALENMSTSRIVAPHTPSESSTTLASQ